MQLIVLLVLIAVLSASGFTKLNHRAGSRASALFMQADAAQDPLLLRAARGEDVERVPVWMMRQAGRHMQCYRDLCKIHKTFRSRSEQPDIATEISLQPYKAYGTDGCILFSDILTPFPAMGVDFDITEKEGPKMSMFFSCDGCDNDERPIIIALLCTLLLRPCTLVIKTPPTSSLTIYPPLSLPVLP